MSSKKMWKEVMKKNNELKKQKKKNGDDKYSTSILDKIYSAEMTGSSELVKDDIQDDSPDDMMSKLDKRMSSYLEQERSKPTEDRTITVQKKEVPMNKEVIDKIINKEAAELAVNMDKSFENDEDSDIEFMRQIRVTSIPELGFLTIGDDISETTINTNMIQTGDNQQMDADDLGECMTELFLYILSNKHPTTIFTIPEFIEKFSRVQSVNNEKFIFFLNNYMINAYYMSEEDKKSWVYSFSDHLLTDENTLKAVALMAVQSDNPNTKFHFEDESYIYNFKKYFGNEEMEKYYEALMNDPDTVLNKEIDKDHLFKRLRVVSIEDARDEAEIMLNRPHLSDERDETEENQIIYDDGDDEEAIIYDDEVDEDEDTTVDSDIDINDIDLDSLAESMMGGNDEEPEEEKEEQPQKHAQNFVVKVME